MEEKPKIEKTIIRINDGKWNPAFEISFNTKAFEEFKQKQFINILVDIEGKNGKREYNYIWLEEHDYKLFNDGVKVAVKTFHTPIPAPKNKKEKGEKTNE
jgi:hypothetical protein